METSLNQIFLGQNNLESHTYLVGTKQEAYQISISSLVLIP